MQLYCRTYKQVSVSHSYGLLRKAKRLDTLLRAQGFLPAVPSSVELTPEVGVKCLRCDTQHSPCFWTEDGQSMVDPDLTVAALCNRCRLTRNTEAAPKVMRQGEVGQDTDVDALLDKELETRPSVEVR